MKKIFQLRDTKKKPERLLETIKSDVRNYLKRERRKKLPEKALFWDFDCRFGKSSDEAQSLYSSQIIAALDKALEEKWDACFVQIIARASFEPRPKAEVVEEEKDEVENLEDEKAELDESTKA